MTSTLKQTIEQLTAEAGFCEFKLVQTDHIIFNQNVRELCDQECREHDIHSWSLPPIVGTYEECYERCQKYPWALLVSAISMTHDISDFEAWMQAGAEMNTMILKLAEQLKPYTKDLLPLGMRCRRCEKCACPEEPCRHPESLLHATEGYGIHIMNTMEQEGITGYYDGQTIVCFGLIFLQNL